MNIINVNKLWNVKSYLNTTICLNQWTIRVILFVLMKHKRQFYSERILNIRLAYIQVAIIFSLDYQDKTQK